jgi:phage terminase large subunit
MKDPSGRLESCPRCGAQWVPAVSINGSESEFWKECSNPSCNSWYNTYIPQEHQASFHRDPHTFVGNFGGYGSGKTLTSREEIYKHVFLTPKGNTLIGANVSSQYEQTIKREIESDLPAAFVKTVNTQKSYMDLANDHRILFRPYDDPDKLRSYNLTSFLIVEASEVNPESFTQLKTRLRNLKASEPMRDGTGEIVYKKVPTTSGNIEVPIIAFNWLKGIIESNPADAWIKRDVLMNSDEVFVYGDVRDEYKVDEDRRDPAISTHVTSTSANAYLPDDFIENNIKNKPPWWVNRFIYGSFIHSEGRVYPNAEDAFIESFDPPMSWKRAMAHDYGLSDPSVFLYLAIDERHSTAYVYKEVRVNEKDVSQLADICKKSSEDIPKGALAFPFIIDPKSGPKRDYNKKSLSDLYLDYDVYFEPGAINIDARIFRLNTYIISGKLKIMKETCPILCEELKEYKFKEDPDAYSGFGQKPVDKQNHSINCLEWLVMRLPADPGNMQYGVYDSSGKEIVERRTDDDMRRAHALSDVDETDLLYSESSGGNMFAEAW